MRVMVGKTAKSDRFLARRMGKLCREHEVKCLLHYWTNWDKRRPDGPLSSYADYWNNIIQQSQTMISMQAEWLIPNFAWDVNYFR